MHTTYSTVKEQSATTLELDLPGARVVDLSDDWVTIKPLWDQYVVEHPKGNVFHTSEMVRVFEATKGNAPSTLACIGSNGRIAALLVSVRVQTLPRPMGRLSSRAVFYAEPLCDDSSEGTLALAQLLARHDAQVGRSVLFAEVRPLYAPGRERAVLESAGYQYLDYLNFVNDVTRPLEEIWAKLHKGAQYSIRQCQKRGLDVREVPAEVAVDELYPLLKLSYRHSGVPLVDRSLFEATVRELLPHGMARFFGVYEGATPVAMDVMLMFKDQVYLWYGGVSRNCEGSPCSLLRWFELKWAHDHGYACCDSGGAGWPNIPYGVRDFKRKFGGDLVQYGRYRKVYSPWKLALAEQVYKLRRTMFSQNSKT